MKNIARDYFITIKTFTPPDEVYKAIIGVDGWWTQNFNGSANSIDDVFTVSFGETYMTLKVVALVKDKQVAWLVTDSHKHFLDGKKNEWDGTYIHFDIANSNNQTLVTFKHSGLVPQLECYDVCCAGWDNYLHSLKNLIDTGKGNPDK